MKPIPFRPAARSATALLLGCVMGAVPAALATDDDDKGNAFSTRLSGYNAVHFSGGGGPAGAAAAPATLRGAVSTMARGNFRATIDDAARSIQYELSYGGLEGTVTQAHIHFGQRHTVGGIVAWLCQTPAVPAPDAVAGATPTCPADAR
jgi:hypothetical protein